LNTERLIPKAALERAFTSGTANDGTPLGYAFGWMTNVFPGLRHVAHGGGLVAYNNYIIRFLDTQSHYHPLDQSSRRSRPTHPSTSGRGNPVRQLSGESPVRISRCRRRCSLALTR
jgi:hypothetical protein